jgi:hypothetical protein
VPAERPVARVGTEVRARWFRVAWALALTVGGASGCASARLELDLERARIDADQSRIERDRAMLAAAAAVQAAERARMDAETRVAACEARAAEAQASAQPPLADRITVVEGRFSLSDTRVDPGVPLPVPVTVTVEGDGFMEDFAADAFGRIALELPAGRQVLTVSASGYLPQRFAIELPTASGELLLAATLLRRPGRGASSPKGAAGRSTKKANTRGNGAATDEDGVVDPWAGSSSEPKRQRPKPYLADPFKRDAPAPDTGDVMDPFGKR